MPKLRVLILGLLLFGAGVTVAYHAVPHTSVSVYPEQNWILYTEPLRTDDPWRPVRVFKTFEECQTVAENVNNAGQELADCAR